MSITPEFAELAGLFAADGCMQKNYICFWGNLIEDRQYYDVKITEFFQKEFNFTPRCHEKLSNSVYGFYCCKREIINKFQELGFHSGSKTYTVKVPDLIMKNDNPIIWIRFIRGFFDGDGCLNFSKRRGTYSLYKKKHHTYPRIFLTSCSFNVIYQIYYLLLRLGINATLNYKKPQNSKEKTSAVICVRGKLMLEKWMNLIGTSNYSVLSKYLLWKKQGFCPSYTSLEDRQKMLASV